MEAEPKPVILRAFGGEALVRWVVSVGSDVVYVTDAQGRAAIIRGELPPRVIGFPKLDVFEVVAGVTDGDVPDWGAMRVFVCS